MIGPRSSAAAASAPSAEQVGFRRELPSLLIVCGAGGLVAFFFLALYAVKHYGMPIGWDTPRYLDQTNFVAAHGLAGVPHQLPPPVKTLASRAGFPVVILTTASVFGTSTFAMAAVVPAAAAAAFALAAGAFVSWGLRRSVWEAAAVALMVGVSPLLIRLVAPETYMDNLFATAIVTAALVPVLSAVRDGRGFAPAILLIGAAGLAHGPFFAVTLGALALVAVAYAPGSWRAWRGGETPLLATPTGRLAIVGGGAAGVTALGIFGLLRTGPDAPKLSIGELRKKIHEDVPLYRLWLTVPLGLVGASWLARLGFGRKTSRAPSPGRDGRAPFAPRFMLSLFAAWILVCLAGILAYLAGHAAPAHRFLAFMVPFPIVVALGVLALGRLAARRVTRSAGIVVVAAGMVALTIVGYRDLYVNLAGPARGVEWLLTAKVQGAATASAVLAAAGVPAGAPLVFVVDDTGPNPLSYVPEMAYMLRSVLPPDRIEHAYVYVGNPDRYLAGLPTYRDHPATYNANMMRFWPAVRRLLPRHPVALLLQSYNELYLNVAAAHPDWVVAPGVIVLGGAPRPADAVTPPPIPTGPRGAVPGALLGAGALVLFTLIGVGWAIALLPPGTRSFEILALAPAFGLGVLIPAGVLVDAVGIRLTGPGGILAVALAFAVGAALAVRRVRHEGAANVITPA